MDAVDLFAAKAYALDVLRRRSNHPRFDRARFCAGIEGAGGPGEPGWLIRGGVMYVPPPCSAYHSDKFKLADLFAEIDSQQAELFA